jgi:hypothetical protein
LCVCARVCLALTKMFLDKCLFLTTSFS